MIVNPESKFITEKAKTLKEQHKGPNPNLTLIKYLLEVHHFEEALVEIKNWIHEYGSADKKLFLTKVAGIYVNILIKLKRFDEGIQYLEGLIGKFFKGSLINLYSQLLDAKYHHEYLEFHKGKSEMTGRFIPDIGKPAQGISKIAMYKSSYIYTALGSHFKVQLSQGHTISSPNRITMVSCGKYFYSILDDKGLIYNIGNEMCVTSNSFPCATLNRFTSISAGGFHCTAISDKGELFTWGKSVFGCLGHGVGTLDQEVRSITRVQFFEEKKIKKVSAFGWNTAAITEDGDLYTWGRNHRGQIGIERAQVEESNSLYRVKRHATSAFLPDISISLSSVANDYAEFVNNKAFSDIHITKKGTVFYIHSIFLITLQNNGFLNYIASKKGEDGIAHLDFEDFLFNGYKHSHPSIYDSESKSVISNIIQSDMLSNESFQELLHFLYTNRLKTQTHTNDLNTFSDIFNFSPLKVFIEHKLIISVPPSASTKLCETLETYLTTGELSDMVIKVGDLSIPTHRAILVARCPHLKELITEQTTVLNLDEKDKKNIPSLLRYLYVDRFKFDSTNISGNDILQLLSLATRFKLKRLEEGCQKLVSGSVTTKNAVKLMQYAVTHNISQLKNFLTFFISNNYHTISKDELNTLPTDIQVLIKPIIDDLRVVGGQYEPIKILSNISDIAVGEKMMVALDYDNKLYQLGRGSGDVLREKLTTITLPTKEPVVLVRCGSSHACVMTQDQKFYGWGAGFEYQLKTPRNKFFEEPVLIEFDSVFNNVTCGTHSTFAWSDDSEYPFPPSTKGTTPITSYSPSTPKQDVESIKVVSQDSVPSLDSLSIGSTNTTSDEKPFDCVLELISSVESKEDEEPQFKTLYVHSSKLPEYLYAKYKSNRKENEPVTQIKVYEFSYEMIKSYFNHKYNQVLTIQGTDFVEYLNMFILLKDFPLAKDIFEKIKYLLNAELSCSLLISIFEKGYQDRFAFLVQFLIRYIKCCRNEVIKTIEYQSLPYQVLGQL